MCSGALFLAARFSPFAHLSSPPSFGRGFSKGLNPPPFQFCLLSAGPPLRWVGELRSLVFTLPLAFPFPAKARPFLFFAAADSPGPDTFFLHSETLLSPRPLLTLTTLPVCAAGRAGFCTFRAASPSSSASGFFFFPLLSHVAFRLRARTSSLWFSADAFGSLASFSVSLLRLFFCPPFFLGDAPFPLYPTGRGTRAQWGPCSPL